MQDTSRGLRPKAGEPLREAVVHGLAKVGLVWALAVLGAFFVLSAAYGNDAGSYTVATSGASGASQPLGGLDPATSTPRTIGLALTLAVLAAGLGVLTAGALGAGPTPDRPLVGLAPLPTYDGAQPTERPTELAELTADLPLALALGLTA